MNNDIISPTHYSDIPGASPVKSSKKKIIIPVVIGAVIIAAVVVGAVVIAKTSSAHTDDTAEETEALNETDLYSTYQTYDYFSDLQNIYLNLAETMSLEMVENIAERSNARVYNQSYIAQQALSLTDDYCGAEYITFTLSSEDGANYIEDIVYHDCKSSSQTSISETGDGNYLHFTGSNSNTYDNKTDALLDHLSLK